MTLRFPHIGQTIGGYRIVEEIGRGGMAVVYKAVQVSLNRYVALKVLLPHLASNPEFVQRFEREARAASSLRHPNIVAVYDVGRSEGYYYIAMEYIEGESLRELLIRRKRLPPGEALTLLKHIAAALDYAHRHGFIHRDVKPSNVLIERRTGRAVLTDFGVVKALRERAHITQTGSFIGTVHYAAPEQVRGYRIDHRVDLYALGIITYEMLTGQPPFVGNTAEVLAAHIQKPPFPIHRRVPQLPAAVDAVLQRMLAKRPEERYSSAAAFVADLQRALAGQRIKPPPRKGGGLSPGHRRGSPARIVGGFVAIVSILALIGLFMAIPEENRTNQPVPSSPTTAIYRNTEPMLTAPRTAPPTDYRLTERLRHTIRAQTAEAATRSAQRTATALTRAHLTATQVSAEATRLARETEQAMNATATAISVKATATAGARLTLTAIASQHRCFVSKVKERVHVPGDPNQPVGHGEILGSVRDIYGRPFTSGFVRIVILDSNWQRDVPIGADGVYYFCCTSVNAQNKYRVDLVGERIRILSADTFVVNDPYRSRIVVDITQVRCR